MKPNRANQEDEFLRHPHSGAYIRNPFLDKSRSTPILFQAAEFDFNCLDDALHDWHCIRVTEASLKGMTLPAVSSSMEAEETLRPSLTGKGATSSSTRALSSTCQRAALSRLRDLPGGYEFSVVLRKSTYVPPRNARRRAMEPKAPGGSVVDKVNMEVSTQNGKSLRIENVSDGLLVVWNRAHPFFQVNPGDEIVRVNDKRGNAQAMLEELTSTETLRLTVRRGAQERRMSANSVSGA